MVNPRFSYKWSKQVLNYLNETLRTQLCVFGSKPRVYGGLHAANVTGCHINYEHDWRYGDAKP